MKLFAALLPRLLTFAALAFSIYLAWLAIVAWFAPPDWLFPPPGDVWRRFLELSADGVLMGHTRVTAVEIVAGYGMGVSMGVLSGYPISQVRWLEKILTPYLIAANSVPLVAFAPLLLLWLGNDIQTKIVVSALIVYFPVTISAIAGFHQQSRMHIRLLRSLKANKWQRFIYVELPSALPGILAGMKIAAPLAVVGAVVGEFLGAGEGLGHLIMDANGLFDTPQLFVAIIILALIGIVFYLVTAGLERLLIGPWRHRSRRDE